jgi:hypothetical protein
LARTAGAAAGWLAAPTPAGWLAALAGGFPPLAVDVAGRGFAAAAGPTVAAGRAAAEGLAAGVAGAQDTASRTAKAIPRHVVGFMLPVSPAADCRSRER